MYKLLIIVKVGIFFLMLTSCNTDVEQEKYIDLPSHKESSDMNKAWVKEEHELINKFVQRNQWNTTKTGTGLQYFIYKQGNGEFAKPGMQAMVHFSITLLDGTECYSTLDSSPVSFRIERDLVEYGLHEGITKMKVGDKAKLIIPSYLAHGLAGDLNKIPTLATIVYDIKLLGISE